MNNSISFQSKAWASLNAVQLIVNLVLDKYKGSDDKNIQTTITGFKAAAVYLDELYQMRDDHETFLATELSPVILILKDVASLFFNISENRQRHEINHELDNACQTTGGLLASVCKSFESELLEVEQLKNVSSTSAVLN